MEYLKCGCGHSFHRQGDLTRHLKFCDSQPKVAQATLLNVFVDAFSIVKVISHNIHNIARNLRTLSRNFQGQATYHQLMGLLNYKVTNPFGHNLISATSLLSLSHYDTYIKGQLQCQKIFCSYESLLVIKIRDINYFFVICLD